MEELDFKEKFWGGVFGIIAIVATILEMISNGISISSVLGMIKDVAGTMVVIVLFFAVVKSFLPKKNLDFKQTIASRMEDVKKKYDPLILEDEKNSNVIRYNIASNIDSLFSESPKGYKRLFELDKTNTSSIRFYVNKSFFSHGGAENYNTMEVAKTILIRLQKNYTDYKISTFENGDNSGILVDFCKIISAKEDVDSLMDLIDYTILLFVAENKS